MTKVIADLHKHTILLVLSSAVISSVAILKLNNLPAAQFQILVILVLFYLGWALFYHIVDKTLTLEVGLEYILTATLALVFFYGLLI